MVECIQTKSTIPQDIRVIHSASSTHVLFDATIARVVWELPQSNLANLFRQIIGEIM